MKKIKAVIVLGTALAIAILVYSPHFNYPFPYHIDEWQHISEAIKLGDFLKGLSGQPLNLGFSRVEIGFHFFLVLVSLFSNLVLVYKFLPAGWAMISALVLFFVVFKKTKGNFLVAWLAMIFFGSIKSNVNLTGLWFFTPLTFAIPFVFLYFYFFTEGVEKKDKRSILISLAIIIFLLPIHAISVLFAVPAVVIYLGCHYQYLRKEAKFFSVLSLIPLAGVLFYKYITATPWNNFFTRLLIDLQFYRGWGVLEINNSFLEIYSWFGYVLAIAGVIFILLNSKKLKNYLAYLLWPATVLGGIVIYRLFGVSFLVPYQRNLYYLAISLPILSGLGLYFSLDIIKVQINRLNLNSQFKKYLSNATTVLLVVVSAVLAFQSYYKIPQQINLYQAVSENDYQALFFLAKLPPAKIIAPPLLSSAIFPLTRHEPVGKLVFSSAQQDINNFFLSADCLPKRDVITKYEVKYVISPYPISCVYNHRYFKLLYRVGSDYVYEIVVK